MRTRRELSQQDSDQTPLTFCDVAACFSEEEKKLLHHWQKELYKNVMNEIHQALTSLGPLIATSVFSLRPKEKEDGCPVEHLDSEIRGSMNPSSRYQILNSEHMLRMEQELESSLLDDYVAEGGKSSNDPSAGHVALGAVVSFTIKEEGELYSVNPFDSERRASIAGTTRPEVPTPAASLSINEEGVTDSMDLQAYSRGGRITSPAGPEVPTPVASLSINEEGVTYSMDTQDYSRRDTMTSPAELVDSGPVVVFNIKEEGECFSVDPQDCDSREIICSPTGEPDVSFKKKGCASQHLTDHQDTDGRGSRNYLSTGNGSMNRKPDFGNPVKCNDKSTPSKSTTGKVTTVVQSFGERTDSVSQMWSESGQERKGEKSTQWQSDCNQPTRSSLHQSLHYVRRSDSYSECETTTGNMNIIPCDSNTLQRWSLEPGPESEKTFSENHSQNKAHTTHSGKGQCTCTKCEKNLPALSKRFKQERTQMWERPYHCTICEKSFTEKGVLIRHQRIHMGERPYQCTVCGKSFKQKEVLVRHQKIHTGERPYQCTVCGKSFSRRETLIRHQTTHMKVRTALEL